MSTRVRLAVAVLSIASCARWAQEPRFGSLRRDERAFEFQHNIELLQISNGMRVALIHDTRTNLATVDVRYDVGAAEDPVGKTGLAHLVEHLTFELRAEAGGPSLGDELGEISLYNNAYTMWDETHYTSTGPIEQLPAMLALEARRLRASCDQLDEATFLRERDVVLAETAQRSNPTVAVQYAVNAEVYGRNHPYARPLGTNDVAGVTRADACAFLLQHYGANRVSVVISGPFDPATIGEQVGAAFGKVHRKVAARARVARPDPGGTTSRHRAPIDKPTALVVFSAPAWGERDNVVYQGVRRLLGRRLAELDEERPEITSVSVFSNGGPRAPTLVAALEVRHEGDLPAAARQVFTAAATMLDDVSPRSLQRMLGAMQLDYVSRWDDLSGRGNWIADYLQYTDHTWFMLRDMGALATIDWKAELTAVSRELIAEHAHVAFVIPTGDAAVGAVNTPTVGSHALVPWHAPVDPDTADQPLVAVTTRFEARIETYELANGMLVELAPDPASPIVDARLVFPVGRAHEPPDRRNLATAAAWLLDHDVEGYYQPHMVDKLLWSTSRGTQFAADVSETTTTFHIWGLAHWADWHLWYLSWIVDQGRYNRPHLERMHAAARELAHEGPDEVDRDAVALRARLFGDGHPYAVPEPDVGAAYLKIGAGDLERWKQSYYRAYGATLIISGDFDVAEMKRVVGELFGPWSDAAPPPLPSVPEVRAPRGPSYLAADDEDAGQVTLTIGFALGRDRLDDRAARAVLREMIKDEVRVVREGMGASYGVSAATTGGVAGRALLVHGRIDEARGGDVARLILDAIVRLRQDAASQRSAFVRARRKLLAQAVARTGGAASVASELEFLAGANLPLAYPAQLAERIAALTPADVAAVAATDLAPERMVVQLHGKPAIVAAAYRQLGITPTRP